MVPSLSLPLYSLMYMYTYTDISMSPGNVSIHGYNVVLVSVILWKV